MCNTHHYIYDDLLGSCINNGQRTSERSGEKIMHVILRTVLIVITTIALGACTSQEEEITNELSNYHLQVDKKVSDLSIHIDQERLRNIPILKQYGAFVLGEKPEMSDIIKTLIKDATTKGLTYQSLVERVVESKKRIPIAAKQGVEAARALTTEFNAIFRAASPTEYNLMLTDPINVLAGMSEGKLARVNGINSGSTTSGAGGIATQTGSELVGNPNYGEWKQGSSGTSFWAFYGQYAFFSSLFSGPVRYGSWASGNSNSYYRNRGRDYYASPSQQQRYQNTEARARKSFAKQGKSFQSPYAKKSASVGSSRVARTPGKFQSGYGNSQSGTRSSSNSKNKFSYSGSKNLSSYNSRSANSSSRSFSSGGK